MTEPSANAIADRFNQVLQKRHLKPGELARKAGVSAATVSHWLKGKNLTFDALNFLCTHMHVSLDWLICGYGCMEITKSQLSEAETIFIYALRHVDPVLASPLRQMLESAQLYQHNHHTLDGHPAKKHIFETGQTFHIIVDGAGTIIKGDNHFYKTVGIITSQEEDRLTINAFDLVAPEFLSRAKQAFAKLQLTGQSLPLYLDVLHQQNRQRIPLLIKGSLRMIDNQLLIDTIIKPLKETINHP